MFTSGMTAPHRRLTRVGAALAAVVVLCVTLEGSSAPGSAGRSTPPNAPAPVTPRLPTLSSPLVSPGGSPVLGGPIRAPGGPYLYDQAGRVVLLHGVNVVYKHPPFEVYPAPGKPWNFSARDASLMARLGFNVVRLGMTWRGLEPGTARANDRAICRRGSPGNPHQFNRAVMDRYLSRLRETVNLLGRYHIYTLLDMHQDVYNEMFDGEGAPNWAVCTDGVPNVDPPGRWSLEYGSAAADIAMGHFWRNNVVGNLQGEYDRIWGDVAKFFRGKPWVLGYDVFNEPFSSSLVRSGDEMFDARLECFYTGTAHARAASHGAPRPRCPKHDPAQGAIATILRNDPGHLVFDEPDNLASRGYPTFVGPMDFPNLVFSVHIYCSERDPVTGNPTDVGACAAHDALALARRAEDRPDMASRRQRRGPAWFVSEFGATSSVPLVSSFTARADMSRVGWTYWAWKYYRDPTGSADEALVMSSGKLRSTARVLAQTYPEAIAGVPSSISFDPGTGAFHLVYTANHAVRAPTVVFVPTEIHYPHGYCARVAGGVVVSRPGSDYLQVQNTRAAHRVSIRLTAGDCTPR